MATIYLVILCLALAATLVFIVLSVREWLLARGAGDDVAAGRRPVYDGFIDRVLISFPVAAAGMVAGLLIDGSPVKIVDIGGEAMLVAWGASAAERLVARGGDGGRRALLAAPVCLVVGLVGGLAGLGQ